MTTEQTSRDRKAIALFAAGTAVLLLFFGVGAYIGRWSKAADRQAAREDAPVAPPAPIAAAAPQEMVRVQAASADSRDRADEIVTGMRKKYTSVTVEQDRDDGRYHVYVGPYQRAVAETVAVELRDSGFEGVELKPFGH